jgi:3'-phosphoadenosine 5'-phosphosulfate sulfotransferase (PAPS reductase)/FAD synthetase
MEYFFVDTGAELPETLAFVDLMEDYLGKEIIRINAGRDFDYYLRLHRRFFRIKQRWFGAFFMLFARAITSAATAHEAI